MPGLESTDCVLKEEAFREWSGHIKTTCKPTWCRSCGSSLGQFKQQNERVTDDNLLRKAGIHECRDVNQRRERKVLPFGTIPISIERNMRLENHHLSTSIITDSGENHQWNLELAMKVWGVKGTYIYIVSSDLPVRYVFMTKGNGNFSVTEPGRHHLNQGIKVNMPSERDSATASETH